jgi:plastocyanin
MKKLITFFGAIILLFYAIGTYAQVGYNCDSAYVISSLPFSQNGLNTNTTGNPYTSANACGSAYMNGNDYVFKFTPAINMNVSISLSNTGQAVGLFVADKYFDNPSANCIASATAPLGNPSIANVALIKDSTYYILVSTNAILGVNQTTAFDINIAKLIHIDASVSAITMPVSGCDLGSQNVEIVINNLGIDSLYNFNVAYDFNGQGVTTEFISDTILPGGTLNYTFAGMVFFSSPGTYYLKAYPSIALDEVPANDTAIVTLNNLPNVSVFPYNQDFEAGAFMWTSGGTNSSWAFGTPAATIINSAASGSKAWKTNLTGNYNSAENSYVESHCFDMTSLLKPIVDLNVWYEIPGNGSLNLQYSIDGGVSWISIGAMGDPQNWYNTANGWSGSSSQWINAKHAVPALAGQSSVVFRVVFNGGTGTGEGAAFDDFLIYDTPAADLGITEVTAPNSGCGLSNSEIVSVKIVNYGTATQNSYDVKFSVDGGSWTTETCTQQILAGDTVTYTFTAVAPVASIGNHTINAVVKLASDTIISNDSITKSIMTTPVISSFPYSQDFEAGSGYWSAAGTNSSWDLGTPASTVINHAASGVNAWKTNLTGNSNTGENSYVESPCFDFTSLIKPYIDMNIWYETALLGTSTVQYSTDNGSTWQTLGANSDPDNWYNGTFQTGWTGNSGNYVHAKHLLSVLAGQPNVKFRISFNAGITGTSEGIAFDDVHIYDTPAADLGVIEIVSPNSDCGLSNTEIVSVKIVNYGTAQQSSFPIAYSINGGTSFTTETVSATILPNDTLTYTFTASANLSTPGVYNLVAMTKLSTDADLSNDTAYKVVTSNPTIATFPYAENFDGANSFWTSGGSSSSWALGTPAKATINSAASSPNSWVTNLTGSHNANELSWVEGPCMDFSTLNNPYITLDVWYETNFLSGVTLEASTDGGNTWATIGASGDPTNWYNGILTTGWNGSAAGWLTAEHSLDGLGNAADVKLRIYFNGGYFLTADGFAFDNVHIFDCMPAIAGFTPSQAGMTVSFTNTSTNGTSYAWDFGDGITSTLQSPSHTYTASGSYTVTLIATNNCDADTITQNITIVGIDEFGNDSHFAVYPNPTSGNCTVSVNDLTAANAVLTLYNIQGEVIFRESLGKMNSLYTKALDLSAMAKGIYYIQLSCDAENHYRRIIIE